MVTRESQNYSQDWFIQAIRSEGGVDQCLSDVIRIQEIKSDFLVKLKDSLCSGAYPFSDNISKLQKKTKDFENTLNFRLGIISPERHGAWFRDCVRNEKGLFYSEIISAPIFRKFETRMLQSLKSSLLKSWEDKEVYSLPFLESGESLWGILLQLNKMVGEIDKIQLERGARGYLYLHDLPNNLPQELDSPSLRAFLLNVKLGIVGLRESLDRSFSRLLKASQEFWQYLETQQRKRDNLRQGAGSKGFYGSAEDIRDRYRKRREKLSEARSSSMTFKALRFMNFSHVPDNVLLKKRYLQLARKLHPDCEGGNEEDFKTLTKYYTFLSNSIQEKA